MSDPHQRMLGLLLVGTLAWLASAAPGSVRSQGTLPSGTQPAAIPSHPNIIVIMADDHAAHAMSCYGSAINTTPNIDRLAHEGMRFASCFCENSLCSPSRAAILTGKYSNRNGVPDLSTPLPPGQIIFPELLHRAGYQTAIVGKWHLHRNPTGFDMWDILPEQGEYYDPAFIRGGLNGSSTKTVQPGYVTDIITDKSIDWLKSRDTSKPFMLLCWHKAPHRHWNPPRDPKYARLYESADIPTPPTFNDDYATRSDAARRQTMSIDRDLDAEDLKEDPPAGLSGEALKNWKYQRYIKDYLRCIASLDDNVGRLLDYVDSAGLRDNTIVIYTSDQGFFLGDHGWYDKRFMYEQALRMPLLVRYPPAVAPGRLCSLPVMNIDFAPTLVDYAGAEAPPPPSNMQGVSLRPLLEGRTPDDWRTETYYHYYEDGPPHHVTPHYGVRTERYKLIRFYGPVAAWEFYDLSADPNELHNAVDSPEYSDQVAQLKRKLDQLREYYGDTTTPKTNPTPAKK